MKKRLVNIGWSSMSGMGPRAWDRDESRLAMHRTHEHPLEQHHVVHREKPRPPTAGPDETSQKGDSNRPEHA